MPYTAGMSIDKRRILYEDEHLLIVNKLAGELVVAATGESSKLPLFDFLKKDYPGLRVVHRLDFQTSGVLVFAKTAQAIGSIRACNFEGWVKTYVALLAGHLQHPTGTIKRQLKARTHDGLVDAVTHYKVLRQFTDGAEVEATIDTGRKHQIRQHFAGIGHPLLRDPLYGDRKLDAIFSKRYGYNYFFLHAARLVLPHPITGKVLHIAAPMPMSFQDVLQRMSKGKPSIPVPKAKLAPKGKQAFWKKRSDRFKGQRRGKFRSTGRGER